MLYTVAEISTRLQDITFWKTVFITDITMGTLKLHTEVQFLFLYMGHKASGRVIINPLDAELNPICHLLAL